MFHPYQAAAGPQPAALNVDEGVIFEMAEEVARRTLSVECRQNAGLGTRLREESNELYYVRQRLTQARTGGLRSAG